MLLSPPAARTTPAPRATLARRGAARHPIRRAASTTPSPTTAATPAQDTSSPPPTTTTSACPLGFGSTAPPSALDAAAASAASPDAPPLPLPPGSLGLPFLGETLAMFSDLPGFYGKRRARAGGAPVIKTHIFGAPTAVVFDKHAVRRLLQHGEGTLVETAWPASTRTLLGEQSMLNATGATHSGQRRVLGQAFTTAAVNSYGRVVETAVRRSLSSWAEAGYFKAVPAAKDLAFDVAARALVAPTMSDETAAAFREDYDLLVAGMMSLPFALPFSPYSTALKARQRLLSRIDALIDDEIGAPPTAPGVSRNALQLMLAATDADGGALPSRTQLQDQIVTQLLAGHETTATSLLKMLTLLSENPSVLAALRAEQDAVVVTHGDALTPAAVAAMPLADATVRETMRIAPIVQNVFRKALVDLDVCGVRVPAGWRVVLMIGGTAADIDSWKGDADVFRPDRWLEPARGDGTSTTLVREPPGFNPFGLGPHICLGAGLALAELRAIVAVLARDYEWAIADPEEPWTPPLPPSRGRPVWFWRRGEAPPAGMVEGKTQAEEKGVPAFLL